MPTNGVVSCKPGAVYAIAAGLVAMGVWAGIQQTEIKHLQTAVKDLKRERTMGSKIDSIMLILERIEKRDR